LILPAGGPEWGQRPLLKLAFFGSNHPAELK
jgi:hypothetical protein